MEFRQFKTRTKPMEKPSLEVCQKFGLVYYEGSPIEPSYVGDDIVWAASAKGDDDPYYALYNAGTNTLKILVYKNNTWESIGLDKIENLYSFLWKMICVNDIVPKKR